MMTVTVNGERQDLPDGTTILSLLELHKLQPGKVAVEVNRRLVKTERYSNALNPDDQVEIVTFVGGG